MPARNVIIALILVVIVAAGGFLLYYYYTQGQVNVYATTGNPDPIYITIQSVELHSKSGNWITLFNKSLTVQLNDNLSFLSSLRIPAGNYTEVRILVKSATITIGNVNVTLTVPSNKIEVPIVPSGLYVSGGSSVYLAIIFGPHLVSNGNGGYILSPVVAAKQIKPPSPGTVQYIAQLIKPYTVATSKLN